MNSTFLFLSNAFLVSLERCVDALSSISATFVKRRRRALMYGMNVLSLKPRVDVLKNCLPSSVTAPNTVSLPRHPVCGTLTWIPVGDQYLRPAASLYMKNASSAVAMANPAFFRRAMRLFVR